MHHHHHHLVPRGSPSPPGNLRVTDVTSTSVTLSWEPPPGPITGYRVEYREAGGEWKEVTVPGSETSYTVTGLKPGTEYEFRVRAVNGAGEGPPSSVSVTT
uniref:FN3con n=1 Tax=synthetic construct TaxID=32630 RepID=UPI0005AECF50|nr:Chain A, FN3con [synthetic construct]